jgi:hypothetical protein
MNLAVEIQELTGITLCTRKAGNVSFREAFSHIKISIFAQSPFQGQKKKKWFLEISKN